MSELIHVMNLTKFLAFSTGRLKPVDNPAPMRASQILRRGGIKIPPQSITYLLEETLQNQLSPLERMQQMSSSYSFGHTQKL